MQREKHMRALTMNTIAIALFAAALNGTAALLAASPAAADAASCPCAPPPKPDFPVIERQGPAAVPSEMWVIFWEIFFVG